LKGLALSLVVIMAIASIPLLALAGDDGQQTCTSPTNDDLQCEDDTAMVDAVLFREQWRELWEDHVWYTREAIIGILDDAPWTNQTVERLLEVAVDTREALRPYYGSQADTFYPALVSHFTIAAQIVQGVRDGTDVTSLLNDWYANARDLSEIMNSMNPQFWEADEVFAMWSEHLNLTVQEATQQFNGQYSESVATFDMIDDQGLEMADMFSNGIMNQFPERFSNRDCVPSLSSGMCLE